MDDRRHLAHSDRELLLLPISILIVMFVLAVLIGPSGTAF
jgi:hypothetical protein